jgi:hypothetical protein
MSTIMKDKMKAMNCFRIIHPRPARRTFHYVQCRHSVGEESWRIVRNASGLSHQMHQAPLRHSGRLLLLLRRRRRITLLLRDLEERLQYSRRLACQATCHRPRTSS